MKMTNIIRWAAIGLFVALAIACDDSEERATGVAMAQEPDEEDREGESDRITVQLCDNETTVEVPADQAVNRENGAQIASALMDQWQRANPDEKWGEENPAHAIVPPADNSAVIATPEVEGAGENAQPESTQGSGSTYGAHTAREVAMWDREVRRAVSEGDRVFHSGDALGSTIAVSCDMCHPNAANTHPETYPKFQVQLGRVVLLRDMINWCIEHPVRGEPLEADDPRMRAMEAYLYAQRRGHTLDYGRR
jgi:thiosulfate dehydrogenase